MSEPIQIPMVVVVRAALHSLKVTEYGETETLLKIMEQALDPAPAQAVKSRKYTRRRKPVQPVEDVA